MIIPDLSIKNRTSVFVLALIIIIFGLYSYLTLPRESTPDITSLCFCSDLLQGCFSF